MGVTVEDVKFTPERVKAILDMIAKHIPYKKACLSNGVSEQMFYRWLSRGEKELNEGKNTTHAQLVESLNKIESERIEMHLNNIQYNENGHKGGQWVLERVFWKYFSAKAAEVDLNERVEALEGKKQDAETKEDA